MLSFSKLFCSVYSTSMLFHQSITSQSKKPLVILLPWLGASESAVAKYSQIYKTFGCEVLERRIEMIEFLRPNLGLKRAKKFLLNIQDIVNKQKCPITVHCTSVGGYFYALMLVNIRNHPELFSDVLSNLKAQVIDSPVVGTLNEMAVGVSAMSMSNKLGQSILKYAVLSYFAITKPFTVSLYNESIEVIKFHPPKVNSLLMTSKNDPMALPDAFESCVQTWLSLGLDVTSKVWMDSEHAMHLKFHKEDYIDLIYQLLNKSL